MTQSGMLDSEPVGISEFSRDEDANVRFMQEAKAASALDHPNICTSVFSGSAHHIACCDPRADPSSIWTMSCFAA